MLDEKELKIYELAKAEKIMKKHEQNTLAKVKAEKEKEQDEKEKKPKGKSK